MSIFDKLRKTAKESQYMESSAPTEEWIRVDGRLVKVEGKHDDAQKGQ